MVIFKKSGQYESVEIMLGSIQREWYSLKLWWPAWKIWMLNYRLCQKSAGRRMSLVDHTQKSLSVGIFLHKKLCCGASHPFGVPISGSPYFGGVGSGSCYCYKSKHYKQSLECGNFHYLKAVLWIQIRICFGSVFRSFLDPFSGASWIRVRIPITDPHMQL